MSERKIALDGDMKKLVTRDLRKLPKMPVLHATIPISRQFSASEFTLIKQVFRPKSMDDRWMIFYEVDRLYLHRSWTGHCIYIVHFKKQDTAIVAYKLEANRNPTEYRPKSEVRSLVIPIRLTKAQQRELQKRAKELGLPVSEYIRRKLELKEVE